MKPTFWGYDRGDGRVGIRNHVLVVATVSCANHVVDLIARKTDTIPITHEHGCLQFGADRELTERTLLNLGSSPNVGAVLYVGLGCEQTPTASIAQSMIGKPAGYLLIQEAGGTAQAVQQGIGLIGRMKEQTLPQERRRFEVAALQAAVKCGGSDYTTALASNPAVGAAADMLIAQGGAVFLTETPGLPGSEHILARRAVNRDVARQIYRIVDAYREEVRTRFGRNISDGNPSPGNMDGGITTLVEKSIGTIKKGGSGPVQGVIGFAESTFGKDGLWIMDTPGHDVFSVSGPAAGGVHVNWFTTGRGSPLGNAITPVIKICGNPETYRRMREDMDIDAGVVMTGQKSIEEVGKEIFDFTLRVANGEPTKSEGLEHREFAIPRIGSTL